MEGWAATVPPSVPSPHPPFPLSSDVLKWRGKSRSEVTSGGSTQAVSQPAPPPCTSTEHPSPGTAADSGDSGGGGDGGGGGGDSGGGGSDSGGGGGDGGGGDGGGDVTEKSFLDIFSASDTSEAERSVATASLSTQLPSPLLPSPQCSRG